MVKKGKRREEIKVRENEKGKERKPRGNIKAEKGVKRERD